MISRGKYTLSELRDIVHAIHQSDIFSGSEFSEEFLLECIQADSSGLELVSISGGEDLILEGSADCDEFYVFVGGKLGVYVGGQRVSGSCLGVRVFGEVGYMSPEAGRIATVMAESDLACGCGMGVVVRVHRKLIDTILSDDVGRLLRLYRNIAREMTKKLDSTNKLIYSLSTNEQYSELLRKLFERAARKYQTGEKYTGNVCDFLKHGSEVFKDFDAETLGRIVIGDREKRPKFVVLPPGGVLFSPENAGHDSFYVVLSGGLEIHDEKHLVGVVGPLGIVGEVSFMNPDVGRIATVSAIKHKRDGENTIEGTILLELSKDYIDRVAPEHQIIIYRNLCRDVGKKLARMNSIFCRITELVKKESGYDELLGLFSDEIGRLV